MCLLRKVTYGEFYEFVLEKKYIDIVYIQGIHNDAIEY